MNLIAYFVWLYCCFAIMTVEHFTFADLDAVSTTTDDFKKKKNCDDTEFSMQNGMKCSNQDFNYQQLYFHSVFDFQRPSSLSLFTLQICRALQLCIAKSNFRVVLHISDISSTITIVATKWLIEMGIPFITWSGVFNTLTLQKIRLESLQGLNRSDQVIYQVDADEFPIFTDDNISSMLQALTSLQSSNLYSCDLIDGYLTERVPSSGEFINITVAEPLIQQLPLTCNIKQSIERAMYRKVIMYRALFRPSIGNHRLICEEKKSVHDCLNMFNKPTSGKNSASSLQQYHPHITRLPTHCSRQVRIEIDHYKYTWGVEKYLEKRVRTFKRAGLPWYRESTAVLENIKSSGGRICVECPSLQCSKAVDRVFERGTDGPFFRNE